VRIAFPPACGTRLQVWKRGTATSPVVRAAQASAGFSLPPPWPPLSIKAFKRLQGCGNWPGYPDKRARNASNCDVSRPRRAPDLFRRYFFYPPTPPARSLPFHHLSPDDEMCEAPRLGNRAGAGDPAAADVDVVTTGGRRRIPAHSSVLVSVRSLFPPLLGALLRSAVPSGSSSSRLTGAVSVSVSARARPRRRRCSAASWSAASGRTGRAASPGGPSSGSAASPTTPPPPSSASSTPAGNARGHRACLSVSLQFPSRAQPWWPPCWLVASLVFAHVSSSRGCGRLAPGLGLDKPVRHTIISKD
jgi:hypothetical protein